MISMSTVQPGDVILGGESQHADVASLRVFGTEEAVCVCYAMCIIFTATIQSRDVESVEVVAAEPTVLTVDLILGRGVSSHLQYVLDLLKSSMSTLTRRKAVREERKENVTSQYNFTRLAENTQYLSAQFTNHRKLPNRKEVKCVRVMSYWVCST